MNGASPLAKKKRSESGQGIFELVLTLFAFFTIAFMFVQLAISLGIGNYIQYVTFISARAYLSGHLSQVEQNRAAVSVAQQMLSPGGNDLFRGLIKPVERGSEVPGLFVGAPRPGGTLRLTAWEQGVTYRFKARLYMMPLIRSKGSRDGVELESQSWLGRDPTQQECLESLEARAKQVSAKQGLIFDNGC